jgi:hypothetical protein
MSNLLLPGATVEVTVPATELIAIFTQGRAVVFSETSTPNYPATSSLLTTVENEQYVSSALSASADVVVTITAEGDAPVFYEVGAAPVVKQERLLAPVQAAPVAVNVTGAVSATAILGGIVTSSTAAAVAGTIPTGTVMDAASEFAVNDSVDWSVINTGGSNAFTVTAATGHTIVGAAAVAASSSGLFRTRKTAANTFVTYRIG